MHVKCARCGVAGVVLLVWQVGLPQSCHVWQVDLPRCGRTACHTVATRPATLPRPQSATSPGTKGPHLPHLYISLSHTYQTPIFKPPDPKLQNVQTPKKNCLLDPICQIFQLQLETLNPTTHQPSLNLPTINFEEINSQNQRAPDVSIVQA